MSKKFLGRPSLSRRDVGFHVATSFSMLSVTLRRGISRRDVNFEALCHVATWDFTSRRHFYMSLSRRDVGFQRRDVDKFHSLSRRDVASNVATSLSEALCHVAT